MKDVIKLIAIVFLIQTSASANDFFPDGSPICWRAGSARIELLGKIYDVTKHGVQKDSTIVQTNVIQAIIDEISENGGGELCFPEGTYLSGSLFFKKGVNLLLQQGAVLKGSDDITDFEIKETRIEGQTRNYFSALINADNLDGFKISGKGTIDGNGLRYWKSFWIRRKVIPDCTNVDELRPRLVYISNSLNVTITDVTLRNSPFWTTHLYKCKQVTMQNLKIYIGDYGVKAPSSDAIDLDVCKDVYIGNCYISVHDDAIALKGGKGPNADEDERNGGNSNILIEGCTFGFCHSVLTCGSESIHNRNILMRNCKVNGVQRIFRLKMRPDTPQNYEYITIENIDGSAQNVIHVKPWVQFFDLKGEKEMPASLASHIVMRNMHIKCDNAFDIGESEQYALMKFTFDNIYLETNEEVTIPSDFIADLTMNKVIVNGEKLKN
ncbi:MAG: glycoside hydrolase family 28 protein [Mangrovibacterium sp.]